MIERATNSCLFLSVKFSCQYEGKKDYKEYKKHGTLLDHSFLTNDEPYLKYTIYVEFGLHLRVIFIL